MLTRDFDDRTRARITEMRAILAKLREAGREATTQLSKIAKQHVSDRDRLYTKLGMLADDVVSKLPGGATADDSDRAILLQEQINDLSAELEEISLATSATEDLDSIVSETLREAYGSLKEAEAQLVKVERLAAKIGI